MKKSRKIFSVILSIAMVLMILAGCAEDSGNGTGDSGSSDTGKVKDIKDIKVGISIGHTQEERWQREIEMFQEYADEHGFEIMVQSAENDAQKQISQCENLISQGIDVLIVQSIDATAAAPIIEEAHAEGIKVISYDRLIMNADLDYYITFDSFQVGVTQAQFVVDKVSEGNFIWLKGGPEDNNAHLVAEGQRSVLQPLIDAGQITIVAEQWCVGWDPNEALKHTENALTAVNNDVQAVIASNDGTAGGAIQALQAQGLNVPIAGQDADLAACQRIVEGTQTGTVYKPLSKLNQAAMELAVAIATGQDTKTAIDSSLGIWQKLDNGYKDVESFTVDVIAIDKDNIYEILIVQEQFHRLEDVFRNVPKDQWPAQK